MAKIKPAVVPNPTPYVRPISIAQFAAFRLIDCLEVLWNPRPMFSIEKPTAAKKLFAAANSLQSRGDNASYAIRDIRGDLTSACGAHGVVRVGLQSDVLAHVVLLKLADETNALLSCTVRPLPPLEHSNVIWDLFEAVATEARPKSGDLDELREAIRRESYALTHWRAEMVAKGILRAEPESLIPKGLKEHHWKAWLALEYAQDQLEQEVTDREAWDYLNEHGIDDEKCHPKLVKYDLPTYTSFTSYLTKWRNKTQQSKYKKRSGVESRSIVRLNDLDTKTRKSDF